MIGCFLEGMLPPKLESLLAAFSWLILHGGWDPEVRQHWPGRLINDGIATSSPMGSKVGRAGGIVSAN